MSMTRTIEIDGKQVPFKASAAIPRIYRVKYGRDIFKDLMKLEKALNENAAEESNLDLFSLETFENIAYLMAKHADPSLPDTAEEWLDEFSVSSLSGRTARKSERQRGRQSKRWSPVRLRLSRPE